MRRAILFLPTALTIASSMAATANLDCKPVSTRYNEVQQLSSHNSYDRNGLKPSILEQAQLGIRSFEFDIHRAHFPIGGDYGRLEWGVFHFDDTFSAGDYCQTLSGCLSLLKIWHDKNPSHEPITLWLQIVGSWRTGHDPADLDANIRTVMGNSVFTPAELLDACKGTLSLQAAVRGCGWPRLTLLQGRFVVVLHGDDSASLAYERYGAQEASAIAFVAPDMKGPDIPGRVEWENAVFFNVHNVDGLNLPRVVFDLGFVSRVWRIDNQVEWSLAYASRAQHLATDHVRGEFTPKAADDCGKPFSLIR